MQKKTVTRVELTKCLSYVNIRNQLQPKLEEIMQRPIPSKSAGAEIGEISVKGLKTSSPASPVKRKQA